MVKKKTVETVLTAASAAFPVPTSPNTSHTGELGRAFRRSEATRKLKQTAGRSRSTSGGHHPTKAKPKSPLAVQARKAKRT